MVKEVLSQVTTEKALDIITARDVLGLAKNAPSALKSAQGLAQAAQSVDSLSQWITIADKGISLLGRVESILGRVETIGGIKRKNTGENRQTDGERRPVYHGDINKEHDGVKQISTSEKQEIISKGGVNSPMVDINQIIQALEMVDTMQPGITCRQLADLIKSKPDEISRIINTAMGAK